MLRQSGHHVQVKFTVDELRQIMDRNHNNRNMSVIAHVEHGMLIYFFVLMSSFTSYHVLHHCFVYFVVPVQSFI